MLDFLGKPFVGAIIGISGIIIGAVFAVVFYCKSKIVAKPRYTLENINLIDLSRGSIPKYIKMLYEDKQITFLNKTIFRFMNMGKKTIDGNELVPDELQIDFSENNPSCTHIFGIEVVTKKRDAISISTRICENNNVGISFNYLDYKDYFVVEILHTGKKIPNNLIGDIKGVPKGIVNISAKAQKRNEMIMDMLVEPAVKSLLRSITRF